MIEFIISKIGILLFAVAVASVLIFFSLGMKDIFVAEQGREIASTIIKQAKGLSETEALCTSLRLNLPRYIDIYGSTETFSLSALNYFFKISKVDIGNGQNSVVFGIYKKNGKKVGKLFAVDSFNTNSQIDFIGTPVPDVDKPGETLTWDPTNSLSNVVYVVKTVINGEEIIHLVKCGYDKKSANPYSSCYSAFENLNIPGVYCVPKED
ncbi:MAG: hypothetical protein PHH82_03495 [Candidatus ainarchaeum sp.]|nr:hypothetical protein [Candidatus ainarchaeum sp.]